MSSFCFGRPGGHSAGVPAGSSPLAGAGRARAHAQRRPSTERTSCRSSGTDLPTGSGSRGRRVAEEQSFPVAVTTTLDITCCPIESKRRRVRVGPILIRMHGGSGEFNAQAHRASDKRLAISRRVTSGLREAVWRCNYVVTCQSTHHPPERAMIPDRIEREIRIAASPERVWSALTEAKHLGTWFGDAGATIDLRPGGEITLTWEKNGPVRGRVERVEPPTVFSFRWIRGGHHEPEPGNHTLVEFTLAPD